MQGYRVGFWCGEKSEGELWYVAISIEYLFQLGFVHSETRVTGIHCAVTLVALSRLRLSEPG